MYHNVVNEDEMPAWEIPMHREANLNKLTDIYETIKSNCFWINHNLYSLLFISMCSTLFFLCLSTIFTIISILTFHVYGEWLYTTISIANGMCIVALIASFIYLSVYVIKVLDKCFRNNIYETDYVN